MNESSLDLETWPSELLVAAVLDPTRAPASREIGARLLCDFGGVGGLSRATVPEIEAELTHPPRSRSGPAASAQRLGAAFELGRRAFTSTTPPIAITNSADVAAWAAPRLSALDHEELWLLALDGRSRVRAVRCVAKGGLHGMGVNAADPLRLALRAAASGFVLVHNHPSGDPTPSTEDVTFTRRVAAAAAVVGTPLLDHVVVARDGYASVPFSLPGEREGAGPAPATAVEA